MDVEKIREDFSMFKNNENFTYLDSAATSLTPDCVVDAMSDYYKKYRATVHRASYKNGEKADSKYNEARETIANYINAKNNEVIFTKGTTSSLNHIARNLISNLTPSKIEPYISRIASTASCSNSASFPACNL